MLSGLATFEYGALGALGSLLFAQVLPWGLALLHGADLHITWTRIVGLLVVIAGTMALGGCIARPGNTGAGVCWHSSAGCFASLVAGTVLPCTPLPDPPIITTPTRARKT